MKIGGARKSIFANNGDSDQFSVSVFFLLSLCIAIAGAQRDPQANSQLYPYARFKSTMAAIIIVLIVSLFFMGFFSIYIRYCTGGPGHSPTADFAHAFSFHLAETDDIALGLDPTIIESFPILSYAQVKDHQIGKRALECAVCLSEFEKSETLRLLPKCNHVFHPDCIDEWLESNVTCPVCRANLIPRPDDKLVTEMHRNLDRNDSMNGEIVIQGVGEDANRSSDHPSRPSSRLPSRWPRISGFGRFRSHSTGHSLIQPVEDLDRFTLRLPAEVRKEVLEQDSLKKTLAGQCSPRSDYRAGPGEWTGNVTSNWRINISDRTVKSDRWVFVACRQSVAAGSGEGSSLEKIGGRTPAEHRPPV